MALRDVTHGTGELLKQWADGNQTDAHDLFLKILLQAFNLALHLKKYPSAFGFQLLDHATEAALGNGNLPREIQHLIELLDVDAKSPVPGSARWHRIRNRRRGGPVVITLGRWR